jgi:hypothetical protein
MTGLTKGLSQALFSGRVLHYDRGRVLADISCAIADGARAISDFRVLAGQQESFGQIASVPTAYRTLEEITRGGTRTEKKLTAAISAAPLRVGAPAEPDGDRGRRRLQPQAGGEPDLPAAGGPPGVRKRRALPPARRDGPDRPLTVSPIRACAGPAVTNSTEAASGQRGVRLASAADQWS